MLGVKQSQPRRRRESAKDNMAKKKTVPPLTDYLGIVVSEVQTETDRGAALIVSAWLDDALDTFLQSRVIDDSKVVAALFGINQPLATFSSRINLAYAFGFIGKASYSDLHIVREVRNQFAHER